LKRFNNLLIIAGVSLTLLTPMISFASAYQGQVLSVTPYNGLVYVNVGNGGFDGASSACPNGSSMVYSFAPTTPFGNSMLAVLLSAKLTGRVVYMYGNGNCVMGTPYSGSIGSETLGGVDFKG